MGHRHGNASANRVWTLPDFVSGEIAHVCPERPPVSTPFRVVPIQPYGFALAIRRQSLANRFRTNNHDRADAFSGELSSMIVALDVHYTDTAAHAAAIAFDEWHSDIPIASHTASVECVAEYEPGKFYMRELPALLQVISLIGLDVNTYVIDAYCHLSQDRSPGLGAHLHNALSRKAAIVGVAKHRYRQSEHAVEVFRAESQRPLFVTAIGLEYDVAGQHVRSMAGQFRIPTLLKAVDHLARATAAL